MLRWKYPRKPFTIECFFDRVYMDSGGVQRIKAREPCTMVPPADLFHIGVYTVLAASMMLNAVWLFSSCLCLSRPPCLCRRAARCCTRRRSPVHAHSRSMRFPITPHISPSFCSSDAGIAHAPLSGEDKGTHGTVLEMINRPSNDAVLINA